MRILTFVSRMDPLGHARLGTLLDDGRTVLDLQAGHFSMTGAPHPHLASAGAFERGGRHARDVARRVAEWVRSERPPGTTTPLDHVRVLRDTWG